VLWAFGLTDKGRTRPINEDCFAIDEDLGLLVVADGVGGHNAGEIAARVAVDAVVEVVREGRSASLSGERPPFPFGYDPSLTDDGNLLRTGIHVACMQVRETAASANHFAGMGTTLVAARVAAGRLSVAHAGDSRLYLLSGGRLRQITRDDSWLASMLAADPGANPDALQHHPMRGALTNVVGAGVRTDVHVAEHALVGGELLLLSTDGVHGVLDGRLLERTMLEAADPRAIARSVVDAALARGSRDNLTAVVARYA
jgi:protein phosphatase